MAIKHPYFAEKIGLQQKNHLQYLLINSQILQQNFRNI
jgi:hypothetical protein